jgi:methylmalonyl-CoA mutase C-terminal domain/subunit
MDSPKSYRVIVATPCIYGFGKPTILVAELNKAGFEVIPLDLEREFRPRMAELRKAGVNVIEAGLQETREAIAEAALRENADAVGFGIHNAHLRLYLEILDLLKEKGMKDVLLFGGSLITPEDAEGYSMQGVGRLFGPGTTTGEIVNYLRDELPRRRKT